MSDVTSERAVFTHLASWAARHGWILHLDDKAEPRFTKGGFSLKATPGTDVARWLLSNEGAVRFYRRFNTWLPPFAEANDAVREFIHTLEGIVSSWRG